MPFIWLSYCRIKKYSSANPISCQRISVALLAFELKYGHNCCQGWFLIFDLLSTCTSSKTRSVCIYIYIYVSSMYTEMCITPLNQQPLLPQYRRLQLVTTINYKATDSKLIEKHLDKLSQNLEFISNILRPCDQLKF